MLNSSSRSTACFAILLCAFNYGCNNKGEAKKSVTQIVSGTDTIVITHSLDEYLTFDVSKSHATKGHHDTITGVTTITFCNSLKKDRQFINSGNGKQHNNIGSGTQVINN